MHLDVGFFWHFLVHPPAIVWEGLLVTICISVVAQTIGVVLGLFIALARRSNVGAIRMTAALYVWVWRGTPVLVQLMLIYTGVAASGLYRYPDLKIGPLILAGPMQAALITLSCNEGAYMSEILRAAIQAIPRGQYDAARALGLRSALTLCLVILPQAARIVVPPLGNEFTLMVKGTSLLSVIGVREFFGVIQDINSATFRTFELFIFAALWYLVLTSLLGIGQRWLEARLGRHEAVADISRGAALFRRLVIAGSR